MHIISVPLIDGAGIYSGVQMLKNESANNKASAITLLSLLLGVNAGLGATAMFAHSENMAWVRTTVQSRRMLWLCFEISTHYAIYIKFAVSVSRGVAGCPRRWGCGRDALGSDQGESFPPPKNFCNL
jgi:hypothetical protein